MGRGRRLFGRSLGDAGTSHGQDRCGNNSKCNVFHGEAPSLTREARMAAPVAMI